MYKVLMSLFIIMVSVTILFSLDRSKIINNVASGQYLMKKNITIGDLRNLPVPKSNENYAFLQSIDRSSNIVIGEFSNGNRKITLIKDRNSDGKVDLVVEWNVETKTPKFVSSPRKKFPDEKFKKMKMDILNGKVNGILRPNIEGRSYLKALLDSDSEKRIDRYKSGYRVSMLDPDSRKNETLVYLSSYDVYGASLSYEVIYRRQGANYQSPTINFSVFCKNSKDKLIIKQTKEIIKLISKYTTL